jgi:hypothetical protein
MVPHGKTQRRTHDQRKRNMSSDHSDDPTLAEQRNSARTTRQVGELGWLDTDPTETEAQQFSLSDLIL